ncbi:GGDEF domain-containing response regulator [Amphibiibacter pelophylacis]|uniref:Diguanylate cyclase n=1 Tax=Amphibiibacter pelophylacis TaxID=1799477 RepID=A0ACC6P2B3_9BURK
MSSILSAIPPGQGLNILVVDDQELARSLFARSLTLAGHRVTEAVDHDTALAAYAQHQPDLILLDVEMPGQNGYAVARRIRAMETGTWTPIIFLSASSGDQALCEGIEAGGDDYLIKPSSEVILLAKIRAMQRLMDMRRRLVSMSEELHRANSQLAQLTETDALTQVVNRRGFDRLIRQEIMASRREGSPMTLALLDIDFFKAYNDRLGHAQGDVCLQQVAGLLRHVCQRPRDVVARYGGEEFALILPQTPKSGAMTFARAVIRMFSKLNLPHPDSSVAPWVTVSGGLTTCVADADTTAEGLFTRADESLYAAKRQGRNCFFSFEMRLDTAGQAHRQDTAIRGAAA